MHSADNIKKWTGERQAKSEMLVRQIFVKARHRECSSGKRGREKYIQITQVLGGNQHSKYEIKLWRTFIFVTRKQFELLVYTRVKGQSVQFRAIGST